MSIVMSIQITPTQLDQYTPLNPYTRQLLLDFQYLRPLRCLLQPLHLTVSYSSQGDNSPDLERAVQKNAGPRKNGRVNFINICTKARHSFLVFARCHASSSLIPLLLKPTFTPSIHPTYLDLPTRPPLPTPVQPYGTRSVSPHAKTISILSGPLYSLTPFLYQLSG